VTNAITVTTEKQVKSDRVRGYFSKYGANIVAQNISASTWSNKNVIYFSLLQLRSDLTEIPTQSSVRLQ
jgi:hypothetical protein